MILTQVKMDKKITYFLIACMIIIVALILFSMREGLDYHVIDLPETDWYNFQCGSDNVNIRTKDYLSELTKKDILKDGGKQSDIDAMDLTLDNIISGYGNQCHVTYSFKTPKNGQWVKNTSPRVQKIKTINYQTVQFDSSGIGYGGYDYEYPGYSRPYMGWRWNTPFLFNRPYWGGYGGYGGHRGHHRRRHH